MALRPAKMNKPEDVGSVKSLKPQSNQLEDFSVQYVKGVGPRRAQLLTRLSIETLEDLFFYFPWRYEDRKDIKKISALKYGNHETTVGEVKTAKVITTRKKGMKIFELTVADETGLLKCKWFNQPYLERYFNRGHRVILSGIVKGNPYLDSTFTRFNASVGPEMDNPDFELFEHEDTLIHTSRIVPVYRATEGFSPKQLRTLLFNSLQSYLSLMRDYLPEDIIERNNLMPLNKAIREIHFPEEMSDIDVLNRGVSKAHRRLIFDEFFLLELGLALMKKKEVSESGIPFEVELLLVETFLKTLTFELTHAQKQVFEQIKSDMRRGIPMNRLIHGDVGCGKTVIALLSILIAVDNGYQACLMVPTEILAEQHFINICRMVEPLNLEVVLLTSSSKTKPAEKISGGKAQIIIGTHSLIQEQVNFSRLGLAVIDEQHKFGVVQRSKLRKKGLNPDILIMTATPIPRTLALTVYGDLDISLINEMPSGRKPIETKVFFPTQREKIYSLISEELSHGRQVYVVYPLIEGSEKVDLKCAVEGAEAFQKIFTKRKVGLIHGKIRQEEREALMASFKKGDIDILVATTVIEVGVDIPNASLMLIVHAERFGLAQLHQLRGRIGRGSHQSYCMLMAYPPFSEEAKRRLKAMASTNDGFQIAEEDLAIRGPGEFFGTKQSGLPDLRIAHILRDIGILETARKEAFLLADSSTTIQSNKQLKSTLFKRWKGRLELIKS
jgi:ATP-dependent DNA helicase RecG